MVHLQSQLYFCFRKSHSVEMQSRGQVYIPAVETDARVLTQLPQVFVFVSADQYTNLQLPKKRKSEVTLCQFRLHLTCFFLLWMDQILLDERHNFAKLKNQCELFFLLKEERSSSCSFQFTVLGGIVRQAMSH